MFNNYYNKSKNHIARLRCTVRVTGSWLAIKRAGEAVLASDQGEVDCTFAEQELDVLLVAPIPAGPG